MTKSASVLRDLASAPPSAKAEPPTSPGSAPALLPLPAHIRIAIVGSGFSGLGVAVALSNEGYGDDLLILERRSSVGGTWHDNSYPGCRCDVPSNLYSFSFAPNPHWSETFSAQPEIERYLQRTARRVRGPGEDRLRRRAREGPVGRRPQGSGASRRRGAR